MTTISESIFIGVASGPAVVSETQSIFIGAASELAVVSEYLYWRSFRLGSRVRVSLLGWLQAWQSCQRLCTGIGHDGKEGLHRRVKNFDIKRLNLRTVERARHLLSDFNLNDVNTISKAAGAFYTWVSLLCPIHFG